MDKHDHVPPYAELPPGIRAVLGPLQRNMQREPETDAAHERMRARFRAALADHLALPKGDPEQESKAG